MAHKDDGCIQFIVSGRKYEGLSFRELNGALVVGLDLFKKCKEVWANAGYDDRKFILSHQAEIPNEIQDIIMVFPKDECLCATTTLAEDTSAEEAVEEMVVNESVVMTCILWNGEKWEVDVVAVSPKIFFYDSRSHEQCRFMRRLP